MNEEQQKQIDKICEEVIPHINDEIIEIATNIHESLFQRNGEVREDNFLMTVSFVVLSFLQYKKEGTYGASWRKRGEMDAFLNLARKFDRLENILLHKKVDEVGETSLDTAGDAANYANLLTTLLMRNNPKALKSWLDDILKEES